MKSNSLRKAAAFFLAVLMMACLSPIPSFAAEFAVTNLVVDPVVDPVVVTPILTVPAAPSELTGTLIHSPSKSTVTVKLEWSDNSLNEKGFLIQRKGAGESAPDEIAVVSANVETYEDTYDKSLGTVEYWVRAYNSVGDSDVCGPILISYTIPTAVTDLVAQPKSGSGVVYVSLSWKETVPKAVDYYEISKKEAGGTYAVFATTSAVSFEDFDVTQGKTYFYQVDTVGYYGGATSGEASTTIPAAIEEAAGGDIDFTTASDWATEEIQKAYDLDLTTDKVLKNFQKNITREEFCEIAVKLYEALSGKTAKAAIDNPFDDTTNTYILKAFELGIVKGTSDTAFSPNNPITRQEICVMIYRTLKADDPSLGSGSSTAQFADQSQIASWAIDAVRFANENGIMKGTGSNKISPLNNTTREQAIVLLERTFESFE